MELRAIDPATDEPPYGLPLHVNDVHWAVLADLLVELGCDTTGMTVAGRGEVLGFDQVDQWHEALVVAGGWLRPGRGRAPGLTVLTHRLDPPRLDDPTALALAEGLDFTLVEIHAAHPRTTVTPPLTLLGATGACLREAARRILSGPRALRPGHDAPWLGEIATYLSLSDGVEQWADRASA